MMPLILRAVFFLILCDAHSGKGCLQACVSLSPRGSGDIRNQRNRNVPTVPRRRGTNIQRWRCARNFENAFNDENASESMECATYRSGPRTLPVGRAATPSAASVETRYDNPASAMKVSATGAMFGRSKMVAPNTGLQTVADPDTAGAAAYIQPDADRQPRRAGRLKPIWCIAVSEESLSIQGIL